MTPSKANLLFRLAGIESQVQESTAKHNALAAYTKTLGLELRACQAVLAEHVARLLVTERLVLKLGVTPADIEAEMATVTAMLAEAEGVRSAGSAGEPASAQLT